MACQVFLNLPFEGIQDVSKTDFCMHSAVRRASSHSGCFPEKNYFGNPFRMFIRGGCCLLLVTVFLMITVTSQAFAVPACDRPFELKQPSGKTFEARQRGDEWYNWVETKDGYGIYKNAATGTWEYYVPADNGTGTAVGANGRSPLGMHRTGRLQDAPKRSIVGEADPAALGIPRGLRPARKEEGRPWRPDSKQKIPPQTTPHSSPLPQESRHSMSSSFFSFRKKELKGL